MIMVQQLPKRWNISLNLFEYVPQVSTLWWNSIPKKFNVFKVKAEIEIYPVNVEAKIRMC